MLKIEFDQRILITRRSVEEGLELSSNNGGFFPFATPT